MKNICIIGAGNIGSRHLQGIKKAAIPLHIEVVDPSSKSLEIAEERYHQVNSSIQHEISFLKDINKVSKKVDLAIIATSSNIRAEIVQKLLSNAEVKYFILEKLLFQNYNDYLKIQKLLKKNKTKAWVNCSMKTMPFYFNLKKDVGNKPIQYIASGSQYGLITNAIHYIDHMAYLTDSYDFTLNTTGLDRKPIESKRKGFLELNGTLNIYFKNGSFGSLTCYPEGNAPILIQIFSESFRCISRETETRAWVSQSDKWEWKEISNTLLFQSEMTGKVAGEILRNGDCNLTPYDQSIKIHTQLLEGLQKFLNKNSKKKYTIYPFT